MCFLVLAYATFFHLISNAIAIKSELKLQFDDANAEVDCINGTRITAFVCLSSEYYKATSPKKDEQYNVQINSSLYIRHVREINVIERYMSVDINLGLYWIDNRITKKFTKETVNMVGQQSAALILPIETLDQIWSPDLYIFDLKVFESYKVISSTNSLSILYNYYWSENKDSMEYTMNNTVIQYYVDARVNVYCYDFDFKSFPFEENNCTF